MTVNVLESAMMHLVEAARSYDEQESGLGLYFLDSLFAEIHALARYGGVYARRAGYHRRVFERFPFAIYYRLDGDEVSVHAVLDCRRNPAWIRRRLRET